MFISVKTSRSGFVFEWYLNVVVVFFLFQTAYVDAFFKMKLVFVTILKTVTSMYSDVYCVHRHKTVEPD